MDQDFDGASRLAMRLACLAGLGLAGCSTATPIRLEIDRLPRLEGRVNTTAGYTGEITTENRTCRGSFTGMLGQSVVPMEISCADGRNGVGTVTIADGRFVSGEARLSDGSRVTVRASGPAFP